MSFFPALGLPQPATLISKTLPRGGATLGYVYSVKFLCDTSSELV
jgi:hypothetical protein